MLENLSIHSLNSPILFLLTRAAHFQSGSDTFSSSVRRIGDYEVCVTQMTIVIHHMTHITSSEKSEGRRGKSEVKIIGDIHRREGSSTDHTRSGTDTCSDEKNYTSKKKKKRKRKEIKHMSLCFLLLVRRLVYPHTKTPCMRNSKD